MAKLKKRHRLRRKDITRISQRLGETFGCQVFKETDPIDTAEYEGQEVLLAGSEPVAVMMDGEPILTVKGMMRYKPTKGFVEVDMGAVPFVTKGADVMAPGIVAADEAISPDDLVWIRDTRNKRPLAVGRALVPGTEMVSSKKGKAVKTLHHVGDAIWQLET
jgi:PUA domain protein